jgi:hypothetical protein
MGSPRIPLLFVFVGIRASPKPHYAEFLTFDFVPLLFFPNVSDGPPSLRWEGVLLHLRHTGVGTKWTLKPQIGRVLHTFRGSLQYTVRTPLPFGKAVGNFFGTVFSGEGGLSRTVPWIPPRQCFMGGSQRAPAMHPSPGPCRL